MMVEIFEKIENPQKYNSLQWIIVMMQLVVYFNNIAMTLTLLNPTVWQSETEFYMTKQITP